MIYIHPIRTCWHCGPAQVNAEHDAAKCDIVITQGRYGQVDKQSLI